MGLAIVAYKNLKKVENPKFDDDGDLLNYNFECKFSKSEIKTIENNWQGRTEGIESNCVYKWEDIYTTSICSYSNYSFWRDILAKFSNGYLESENSIRIGSEFYELIDFSDCDSIFGSVVSKKLYNDFKNRYDDAKKSKSDWWIEIYEKFMKAFEYASQNGAVKFC